MHIPTMLACSILFFANLAFALPETYETQDAVNPEVAYAIARVADEYGDTVSVFYKKKALLKFGRNSAVGSSSYTTIAELPSGQLHETYVTTNIITHAASASTNDSALAAKIEGHTCTGGIPTTFVVQDFTFMGQSKTALTTPLCRIGRLYNNSATDFTGPLYVAQDVTFTSGVPQTATAIHLIVQAGENQSWKAATSLSAEDYWFIEGYYCDVIEKATATVDVRLEVKLPGKVFRPITGNLTCSNTSSGHRYFGPLIIVPPSSDIRLIGLASGTNIDTTGGIRGYLAKIISQ